MHAYTIGTIASTIAGLDVPAILAAPEPQPKTIPEVIDGLRFWIMTILAAVATLFLVIGGLRYMTAGGDPALAEQAKGNFKAALAGYALAVLAPVILQVLQGMLGGLASLLTATFFTSPDVTVFPQVTALVDRSMVVVNAAFVLAIIAAGVIAMTHGTFQIRYQVKDLLPRLVFGLVASNFGVQLCRMLIEAANALTETMVGQTASGPQVIEFVSARIVGALTSPSSAVLAVVIGLIIVVLFYLLLVGWFARIATLIVLAGIAPVALACYALPQTQAAAGLWWRSLLGCLATPLLQAIFFTTGVNLLLDPEHNVPILLGLPGGASTDVFNLFIAACLLMVTARIPKLVARYVTRSGQMSTAGVVLRAVVVGSITRRLRLPGRR